MPIDQSYHILLHRLWAHISVHRQWQFLMLLVLTIFCSFAEVVSLVPSYLYSCYHKA